MKLNWAERWVVNNPSRVIQQSFEMDWFRKRAHLPAGAAVLEVGCGRGAGARLISRSFQPGLQVAMDLDLEMIRKARKYLTPTEQAAVFTYTGDLTNLPHRDGSFDAVFGFGVLHHLPDWQRGLAEIARILKDGGVLFMEELYPAVYQNFLTRHILLHPEENRFRSRDLRSALAALGLKIKEALESPWVGILAVAVKQKASPRAA